MLTIQSTLKMVRFLSLRTNSGIQGAFYTQQHILIFPYLKCTTDVGGYWLPLQDNRGA